MAAQYLPPLPVPAHESVSECGPDYFDASQMREYARAALAATGKQQVGEGEWVRDIHDVEQGLIQRPVAPHAANNAPSPTIRMQVGEVQGDARAQFEAWAKARGFVDFAIYSGRMPSQEGEYQASHLEALWQGWQAARAARQPGAQEPYGWIVTGPNGSTFLPVAARETMVVCAKYMTVVEVYTAPPAQGIDLVPRPMDTAPRDGTMVRLLVQFTEHATEDTDGPAWTIGANNGEHDGGDLWCFAGWCWTHDHFTEGKGTPVGWLPLIDDQREVRDE